MTKADLLQDLWEQAGGRILAAYGSNHKATCPFHEDRNPSASVNLDEGLWRCFSCGRAGDEYTFIQERDGISFEEAAKIVNTELEIAVIVGGPKRKAKPYKPSWL